MSVRFTSLPAEVEAWLREVVERGARRAKLNPAPPRAAGDP